MEMKTIKKIVLVWCIIVINLIASLMFQASMAAVSDEEFYNKVSQVPDWYTLNYLQDSAIYHPDRFINFDPTPIMSSFNVFKVLGLPSGDIGSYTMMDRPAAACITPRFHFATSQFRIECILNVTEDEVIVYTNSGNGKVDKKVTPITDINPETDIAHQLAYFSYMANKNNEGALSMWQLENSSYKSLIRFQLMCRRWEQFRAWGVPETLNPNSTSYMAENFYHQAVEELKARMAEGKTYVGRLVFLCAMNPGSVGQNNIIFCGEESEGNKPVEVVIEKRSKGTGNVMKNVQFTVQNAEGKYFNENGVLSDDEVILTTDSEGKITLKNVTNEQGEITEGNLERGIDVVVTEVNVLNNGKGEENYGYESSGEQQRAKLRAGTNTFYFENDRLIADLIIRKIDEDTFDPLEGIGFTIQMVEGKYAGQYVGVDETGSAIYTEDSTTKVYTDKNGEIVIKNIWKGKYRIVETDCPLPGYFKKSEIKNGVEIVPDLELSSDLVYTITNKLRYVNMEGTVWEDNPSGKQPVRNDLFNSDEYDVEDRTLAGVKVFLKDASGNNLVDPVVTDENGKYCFEDLDIDKFKDLEYYVEFEYNGMSYESVVPHPENEKGSQAGETEEDRDYFNRKFEKIKNNNANGVEGDLNIVYDGITDHKSTLNYETGSVFGYEGAEFPINGVADKYIMKSNSKNVVGYSKLKETTISKEIAQTEVDEEGNTYQSTKKIEVKRYSADPLNLGLYKREQPDLALTKDLKNVIVSINQKEHLYEYDQRLQNKEEYGDGFNNDVKFGVEFQNKYGKMKYTRPIYRADAEFTSVDSTRELSVYATYRIDVRNQSTTLTTRVNEILDYYDSRYELEDVKVSKLLDSNGKIDETMNLNFEISKSEDFGCNKLTINATDLGTLNVQETKTIYVQLKLKRTTIVDILNLGDQSEDIANVAEISSYTIFKDDKVYAGIDRNSNPGNANPKQRDTYEDDTDSAPGFRITDAKARTLDGTVFEDKVLEEKLAENIREGNGIFDNGEDGIEKIRVDLLRKEVDPSTNEYNMWKIVDTKETATDGKYHFEDFAAGDYVIRYIWGDKDSEKYEYMVQNYKATIFNDDKHLTTEWYKDLSEKLSDAKDYYSGSDILQNVKDKDGNAEQFDGYEVKTRTAIDAEHSTLKYDTLDKAGQSTDKIGSITNDMEIKVEYDDLYGKELNIYDQEKNTLGKGYLYPVLQVDFGIVERPRQHILVTKQINHVKIELPNGLVIVDTDITSDGTMTNPPTRYFSNMWPQEKGLGNDTSSYTRPAIYDPNNPSAGGFPNGYARLELDNELIQKTRIEVEYTIKVENTSERDYVDKTFYNNGTLMKNKGGIPEDKPVIMKMTKILDYLDKQWVFDATQEINIDGKWERLELSALQAGSKVEIDPKVFATSGTEVGDRILLLTEALKDKELAAKVPGLASPVVATEASIQLKASKTLATTYEEDVMEYDNEVEIAEISNNGGGIVKLFKPGNYIPGDGKRVEPDGDMAATVVVTPSTGANLAIFIPTIVGIIALTLLGIGVKIINKKAVEEERKTK